MNWIRSPEDAGKTTRAAILGGWGATLRLLTIMALRGALMILVLVVL